MSDGKPRSVPMSKAGWAATHFETSKKNVFVRGTARLCDVAVCRVVVASGDEGDSSSSSSRACGAEVKLTQGWCSSTPATAHLAKHGIHYDQDTAAPYRPPVKKEDGIASGKKNIDLAPATARMAGQKSGRRDEAEAPAAPAGRQRTAPAAIAAVLPSQRPPTEWTSPNVLLCVTGSVAAIKTNQMIHSLQTHPQLRANVCVVMSNTALHFVDCKQWPHLGGVGTNVPTTRPTNTNDNDDGPPPNDSSSSRPTTAPPFSSDRAREGRGAVLLPAAAGPSVQVASAPNATAQSHASATGTLLLANNSATNLGAPSNSTVTESDMARGTAATHVSSVACSGNTATSGTDGSSVPLPPLWQVKQEHEEDEPLFQGDDRTTTTASSSDAASRPTMTPSRAAGTYLSNNTPHPTPPLSHPTPISAAGDDASPRDTAATEVAAVDPLAHLITDDHSYTFHANPNPDGSPVVVYTDAHEWGSWHRLGDGVLHIDLRSWADMLVIAPLSGNTLAKVANGQCDTLATCIIRAWDMNYQPCYSGHKAALRKGIVVAPAMNTMMWEHPLTGRHFKQLYDMYNTSLRRSYAGACPALLMAEPQCKKLACGDVGRGAMATPEAITAYAVQVHACAMHLKQRDGGSEGEGDEEQVGTTDAAADARLYWEQNYATFANLWPDIYPLPTSPADATPNPLPTTRGTADPRPEDGDEAGPPPIPLRAANQTRRAPRHHNEDRAAADVAPTPTPKTPLEKGSSAKVSSNRAKAAKPNAAAGCREGDDDGLSPAERLRRDPAYLGDGGLTFSERGIRLSVDHPMSLALSVDAHPLNNRNATKCASAAKKEKAVVEAKEEPSGGGGESTLMNLAGSSTLLASSTAGSADGGGASTAKPEPYGASASPSRSGRGRLRAHERLVETQCGVLDFRTRYLCPNAPPSTNDELLATYARLRKDDQIEVVARDKKTGEESRGVGTVLWTPLFGGRVMVGYSVLDDEEIPSDEWEKHPLPANGYYLTALKVL